MFRNYCYNRLSRVPGVLCFKRKLTFRTILVLVLVNVVLSMLTLFDNVYYNQVKLNVPNKPLLSTLDTYRSLFLHDLKSDKSQVKQVNLELVKENYHKIHTDYASQDWMKDEKFGPQPQETNLNDNSKLNDYLFNRASFLKDANQLKNIVESNSGKVYLKSRFYMPKVLIDNKQACSSRQNQIFIVCMIHSHRNNFIRRKTMRDTWLSQNKIQLFDLIDKRDQNEKLIPKEFQNLEMVHLFIVGSAGSDQAVTNQTESTFKSLKDESDHFKDIIMIDTEDNYKNLVYKHLTAVNWIIDHCPQALYMVKLDDDVFVNIKPLSKHLVDKFGLNPTDSQFIYCSIVDKAKPLRTKKSKWQVSLNTYPFKHYPRYCEGFSYITNMATVRLMQQQSQIIPRFWIDDVYFTGLLLHGFTGIDWYNYRPVLKWSFYDFWDLGSSNNVFAQLYVSVLKIFNVKVSDYYKADFFVILHVQKGSTEAHNYEFQVEKNSTQDLTVPSVNSKNKDLCFNLNFFSMKNSTLLFNEISRCYKNEEYTFHFYNFCTQLWNTEGT